MIDNGKCKIGYYHTPGNNANLANKDYIDKPPIWYSVDMSDWNQENYIRSKTYGFF